MAHEQMPLLVSDSQEDGDNNRTAVMSNGAATTATTPYHHTATTMAPPRQQQQQPQAIAHRGHKARAPENTMLAFRAAVDDKDARAAALETDLHLSRDGVVVLSHDETLTRCFGVKARVRDRDWHELRRLRTLREPREPMPSLRDLLEWLDDPERAHVWVMLDVKRHDDAEELVRRTAETIASVPATQRPWSERITPCCWDAKYIRLCLKYLPGYRITHVGHSTSYARELVDQVPGLSVSMLRHALASPLAGAAFLRDMRARGVPVHAWTVNEEGWMEWCVRRGLTGVITDDPVLFREVCEHMDGDRDGGKKKQEEVAGIRAAGGKSKGRDASIGRLVRFGIEMLLYHILLVVLSTTTWLKHGSARKRVREELRG